MLHADFYATAALLGGMASLTFAVLAAVTLVVSADDVQAGEQHGQRIHQPGRRVGAECLRVQRAIGEGETQVSRDQH